MRDLVVLAFAFCSAFLGFCKPWLGVLALAVFAYLNPHRYAWGFSRDMPVYLMVFVATLAGIFINGKDRQPFPWKRETILFLMLLTWFAVTTFYDPDVPDAARAQFIKVMKVYAGVFPSLWIINTRYRLRWLVVTIALCFGVIGLKGGVFALATGFAYRVWGPYKTFYYGNNEIALALNMSLPLLLLCGKEAKKLWLKVFFGCVLILSIFSIISSWSRGGLVTLAALGGSMALFGRRKLLTVAILLAVGLLLVPRLPQDWFGRMETIETYEKDKSVQGRFIAWEYATDRALADPLTGGGFETFRAGGVPDAHSAYFEILGEHGFVALALWLSLLFGTIIALQRIYRRASREAVVFWAKDYARTIQLSLIAYAVGGAFLGVAYWDYFYQLVAICTLLKIIVDREIQENMPTPLNSSTM